MNVFSACQSCRSSASLNFCVSSVMVAEIAALPP
jgi:hypothetical protein